MNRIVKEFLLQKKMIKIKKPKKKSKKWFTRCNQYGMHDSILKGIGYNEAIEQYEKWLKQTARKEMLTFLKTQSITDYVKVDALKGEIKISWRHK